MVAFGHPVKTEAPSVPQPPPPRPVLSEDGHVLPTPAAKAAALEVPSVPADAPLCIFCRAPMQNTDRCEAIFCGHAFHSVCLSEWRVCANKGPNDCPFRCRAPQQQMLVSGIWLLSVSGKQVGGCEVHI